VRPSPRVENTATWQHLNCSGKGNDQRRTRVIVIRCLTVCYMDVDNIIASKLVIPSKMRLEGRTKSLRSFQNMTDSYNYQTIVTQNSKTVTGVQHCLASRARTLDLYLETTKSMEVCNSGIHLHHKSTISSCCFAESQNSTTGQRDES
jgi:hypothetical protein